MENKRTSLRSTLKSFHQRLTSFALKGDPVFATSHPIEIIPNLYLGDICAAANPRALYQLGITHILNCSNLSVEFFSTGWPDWSFLDHNNSETKQSDFRLPTNVSNELGEMVSPSSSQSSIATLCPPQPPVYLSLPIVNAPDFSISRYFSLSNEFIHSNLSSGGAVLVHSHHGVSRSVTLILAYLVTRGMLLDDAYMMIKNVREFKINHGFAKELVNLHEMMHGKAKIVAIRGCEEFELAFAVEDCPNLPVMPVMPVVEEVARVRRKSNKRAFSLRKIRDSNKERRASGLNRQLTM